MSGGKEQFEQMRTADDARAAIASPALDIVCLGCTECDACV
jgi:hypothetical protein